MAAYGMADFGNDVVDNTNAHDVWKGLQGSGFKPVLAGFRMSNFGKFRHAGNMCNWALRDDTIPGGMRLVSVAIDANGVQLNHPTFLESFSVRLVKN